MLTKIEVRNAAGSVLTLPLQDISGGYTLKDVDGLDPVKASVVTSSFASFDGVQYESSRRDFRNLILKLGFSPDWVTKTPKGLRDNLYKWFMTKQQIELRFYEDSGLVTRIVGRVESNDSPRFTSDPDATISVICFKPDFVGMTNEIINGTSVATSVETTTTYAGTTETGFTFTLLANRSLTGFVLYQRGADGIRYELDFAANLVSGDKVEISTVPGNKYATITHEGVESSVLYGISPSSPWLVLTPGINKLRLLVTGVAVPYTIAYTDKYGGL